MKEENQKRLREVLHHIVRDGESGELMEQVRQFLDEQKQNSSTSNHKDVPERFGIVGRSASMQTVFEKLEKMVTSALPTLIYGESGTGKELVARALHFYGPRKQKPFFSTNCAAIPETLLEAELFGHKRGSFTGAVADRKGHFVAAHGGSLFLDEIGDMPLAMQSKLLRVLEDHEVRPVGGNDTVKVDVRIIAASNQKLSDLVAAGKFRQDLFFRLHVLNIELPALRNRKEDIPLLVEFFTQKIGAEMGRIVTVSEKALQRLMAHSWPGNVRELENEIRRGAALSGGTIDAQDLRPELQ